MAAHVQTIGGYSTASGQTSLTSTATSFTAGNLLVAIVTWATSGSGPTSISTPSGWTSGGFKANGAPNGGSWVGYIKNNAGGSQSWTWTESGGSAQAWSYTILEFSGVDTTAPLDLAVVDNATGSTSNSTLDSTAASGTTAAGDVILMLCGINHSTAPTLTSSATSVPSSGWTKEAQYYSTNGSPNAGTEAFWQIPTGTVANPRGVATASVNNSWEVFLLTFKAAGGGTNSSGVVDVGGAAGLGATGTTIISSGALNLGGAGNVAMPDLGMGGQGSLAVPDLGLGGRGGLAAPDLALGGAGGAVGTGTSILPTTYFSVGDLGAGLVPTGILILPLSGPVDLGALGGGLNAKGYIGIVLGARGAGLLVTGTTEIDGGIVDLGAAGGGLLGAAILVVSPGVVSLGGRESGLADTAGTTVVGTGALVGSLGGGLVPSDLVLVSATQFAIGGGSGGLLPVPATQTIRPGLVDTGNTGSGLQATSTVTIAVAVVMGSRGGGFPPIPGGVGYPGGSWHYCTQWIWRETFPGSGVGHWVLGRWHIWRSTGWNDV